MRRVIIVGGGSAGWMTAAYLNGALNDKGQKKTVDITLIESPNIPRISVGEATVPSIHHMLEVIGVNEIDFMKATDATFKQSIKYVNWLENKGESYHHPFSRATPGPIDRTGVRWMESLRDIPFMETVSSQAIISEINRAPKPFGGQSFMAPLKYAYHFDAWKRRSKYLLMIFLNGFYVIKQLLHNFRMRTISPALFGLIRPVPRSQRAGYGTRPLKRGVL